MLWRRARPTGHLGLIARPVLLLALAGLLLAGCGREGERRAGWSGSETPGRIGYRYRLFTGTERAPARLEVGELLTLNYDATVTAGRLTIRVMSPEQDPVWKVTLTQSGRDRVELLSMLAGTYAIEVQGEGAAGSLNVRWEIARPGTE